MHDKSIRVNKTGVGGSTNAIPLHHLPPGQQQQGGNGGTGSPVHHNQGGGGSLGRSRYMPVVPQDDYLQQHAHHFSRGSPQPGYHAAQGQHPGAGHPHSSVTTSTTASSTHPGVPPAPGQGSGMPPPMGMRGGGMGMAVTAAQQEQQIQCKKNLQKMMGISPSDIDKYSRIFFPISFTCFNLMYWIIYLHVSDEIAEDLVMLHPP